MEGLSRTVSLFPRKRYRNSVSKYDAERQEQIRIHILRIARQLVAGEIDVIAASRELGYLRHEVEPQLANVLVTSTAIDSETDALPVGDMRKEWSPEALKRKDKEIAETEDFYRESAINAATELIRLLETPSLIPTLPITAFTKH
jgi:outer membrane translocation and assembly module TamA